jgi:hypothetical protein
MFISEKNMKINFLPLYLLLFASLVQAHPAYTDQPAQIKQPGQGCTVVYAASGDLAFAGNNEDSYNPLTRAWFIPASDGRYGWVYFGYDDLSPQGGLNDQGLFFDGLYVPYKALDASARKPDFPGGPLAMIDEVMARSTTVDEVLAYFERYSRPGLEAGQLFFGDKFGNSAIVEGDAIIRKKGSYQIATNFRQSENPGPPYFDGRYNTADKLLSQAGNYSVERIRQVLDATHQEDHAQTVYSQVYDLKQGLIYMYLFHDYRNVTILNLADELAKGPHMVSFASLFPENQAYEQWSLQMTDNSRSFYEYKIDKSMKPANMGSLVGKYRIQGDTSALPVRIYLENDQLYLQNPNELPLELYPDSASTVFHPFYNNTELKLTFELNLLGQVTGAEVRLVYDGDKIAYNHTLCKTRVLSNSQIRWLALLIVLTILVFVIRRRRAGHKI